MGETVVNGIRLHYSDQGEGQPLVMLHGLSDDGTFWAPLAPLLSPPWRVVAPDLRGHGKSDRPPGPYHLARLADDVAALLDVLDIRSAHLAGLSMGSAVALEVAARRPEAVRSLTLLSAFPGGDPGTAAVLGQLGDRLRRDGFGAFFDAILPLVVSDAVIAEYREPLTLLRAEKVRSQSVPATLAALEACREWDGRGLLGRVRCPVLLLSGREDRLTPPALAGGMHAALPGSRWEIVDGVGHNLLLPGALEAVAGHLRAFLSGVGPRTAP